MSSSATRSRPSARWRRSARACPRRRKPSSTRSTKRASSSNPLLLLLLAIIELMVRLSRMPCEWEGANIRVMGEVVIKPPYQPQNCVSANTQVLSRVKKVVRTSSLHMVWAGELYVLMCAMSWSRAVGGREEQAEQAQVDVVGASARRLCLGYCSRLSVPRCTQLKRRADKRNKSRKWICCCSLRCSFAFTH